MNFNLKPASPSMGTSIILIIAVAAVFAARILHAPDAAYWLIMVGAVVGIVGIKTVGPTIAKFAFETWQAFCRAIMPAVVKAVGPQAALAVFGQVNKKDATPYLRVFGIDGKLDLDGLRVLLAQVDGTAAERQAAFAAIVATANYFGSQVTALTEASELLATAQAAIVQARATKLGIESAFAAQVRALELQKLAQLAQQDEAEQLNANLVEELTVFANLGDNAITGSGLVN